VGKRVIVYGILLLCMTSCSVMQSDQGLCECNARCKCLDLKDNLRDSNRTF